MEIKLYLRMLQKGWWIIALTILVAINVALITSYFTKPIYQASASYSVSPSASLAGSDQDVLNSLEALDKRSIIQTYAEFLNSQRIYEETVQAMGLSMEELAETSKSTVVLPDANILVLPIQGPDAVLIADLANKVGKNAIDNIKQLYKVYDINPLDPASVPSIPIRPQPVRDAGVAALLGIVIGAALAIVSGQVRVPLEAYKQRASLDAVSNVYNRRYIQNRLDEWTLKGNPETYSLGMIRLNSLRDMIDTLPANVVQQLLREVTATFKKELRGNDLIGRWNDTTFVLVLPSTPEIAATRTVERIRAKLLKPILLSDYGENIQLDPVIGVSSFKMGETANNVSGRAEDQLDRFNQKESSAQA